mmetsp:Transcript_420/g.964  ORF Transcript_420/g.964 Transcript_420/m.964 type:complete len:224 (-) Transcript_420:1428-2099(-)
MLPDIQGERHTDRQQGKAAADTLLPEGRLLRHGQGGAHQAREGPHHDERAPMDARGGHRHFKGRADNGQPLGGNLHEAHAASGSRAHSEAISGAAEAYTQGHHEDEREVPPVSSCGAPREAAAQVAEEGQVAAVARQEEGRQEEAHRESHRDGAPSARLSCQKNSTGRGGVGRRHAAHLSRQNLSIAAIFPRGRLPRQHISRIIAPRRCLPRQNFRTGGPGSQ